MMKLKSFGNLYNLLESTILDIYSLSNDLYIKASFEFYQEFMANGCRSDFDYEEIYLFRFINTNVIIKKDNKYIINSFKIDNDLLYITINENDYIIDSKEVEIKRID